MLDQAEAHQHQHQQKQEQMMVIKGKRSKRPRPASPLTPLITTMSTSSSGLDDISTTTTTTTTQEEEDMAYCLILLAQGGGSGTKTEAYQQQRQQQQSSVAVVYECKTCNRCFPSFQALGGHRASHKKPKTMTSPPPPEPERWSVEAGGFTVGVGLSLQMACNTSSNTLSAINFSPNVPNKLKVHACGICRAEFSSGQALGGHMRRHRSPVSAGGSTPATQSASSPPINLQLCLDLNLPAEEEHQEAETHKFMFGSNENTLVFTAGALVDCRY